MARLVVKNGPLKRRHVTMRLDYVLNLKDFILGSIVNAHWEGLRDQDEI